MKTRFAYSMYICTKLRHMYVYFTPEPSGAELKINFTLIDSMLSPALYIQYVCIRCSEYEKLERSVWWVWQNGACSCKLRTNRFLSFSLSLSLSLYLLFCRSSFSYPSSSLGHSNTAFVRYNRHGGGRGNEEERNNFLFLPERASLSFSIHWKNPFQWGIIEETRNKSRATLEEEPDQISTPNCIN